MGPWFSDRLPLNSKRLSDAAFTRTAERAFTLVKNDYFGEFGYLSSSCIIKHIILMFLSSSTINSRFCSKPQLQMFLLVPSAAMLEPIRMAPTWRLPAIQISISCLRKTTVTWILASCCAYLSSFLPLILDFIYSKALILISIYFEWRDNENQQFPVEQQYEDISVWIN